MNGSSMVTNIHVSRNSRRRLAIAYPASRWFTSLLELVTVTTTRGLADDEEGLLHKIQVYVVTGIQYPSTCWCDIPCRLPGPGDDGESV